MRIIFFFLSLAFAYSHFSHCSTDIDWQVVDLADATFWNTLSFPKEFSFGIATSAYQIEGTQTHNGFVHNNFSLQNPTKHDSACGHWQQYKEDAALIANLGVDEYRFSIAWEKIEPQEGEFDNLALQHYSDLCDELVSHNIKPIICLFHFTLPVWFYQKGGFEHTKNCHYFIRFATYVFKHLHTKVARWITFNEPTAYALEAYFNGAFPPYKSGLVNLATSAGSVLRNILMTHVELYETYKKLDPTCTIGIVHMFHLLESLNNTAAERFIVHASDALMHDPVLSFFKTGTLTWLGQTLAINPSAPKSLDFFGVNYYTRELISWSPLKPWHLNRGALNPQENITDMGWPVYPEGLLKALQKAQQLDLPLYISENGIATTNPALRNEFIKKHLYVIQKALKQGFDIRGYTYWSLMDCYEWKYGYTKRFGLYFVDYAHNNQRSLCPGAISFVNFIKSRPCGTL